MEPGNTPGALRKVLLEVGEISAFTGQFFREAFRPRFEWRELIRQAYLNGYLSLPLVAVTAFIMGLVLTIQSRPTLEAFRCRDHAPGDGLHFHRARDRSGDNGAHLCGSYRIKHGCGTGQYEGDRTDRCDGGVRDQPVQVPRCHTRVEHHR
jgi:hypothetical protein